jgi:hypothetical protein
VPSGLKTIGNPAFVHENCLLSFSNNQLSTTLNGVFVSGKPPNKLISSDLIPFDNINEFTEYRIE